VCFFKGRPGAGPCDGALIRAHLVPRQLLKREFPEGVAMFDGEWISVRELRRRVTPEGRANYRTRTLRDLCDDERSWVPCCGGPLGPGGHHGQLDQSRHLRIPRADLPADVEEFAAELGLTWWIEREYGPLLVCDSCGRGGTLSFSPAHAAHFCGACFARENGHADDIVREGRAW
jgi:hypothetical protein